MMRIDPITAMTLALLVLAFAAVEACGGTPVDSGQGELTAEIPAQAAAAARAATDDGACDCQHRGCGGDEAAEVGVAPVESVSIDGAPSRGRDMAKITVVVFSDFECPFCKTSEATIRELEQQYPGDVKVVFRNHPLPIHKSASLAAKAALAAGEQGRFWEYHDALFADQNALDRSSLERHAKALGLDLERFRRALDGVEIEKKLQADEAEAKRLSVYGTPTFFVNGRRVAGAQPLAAFKAAAEAR